jgi:hypothetical protein
VIRMRAIASILTGPSEPLTWGKSGTPKRGWPAACAACWTCADADSPDRRAS